MWIGGFIFCRRDSFITHRAFCDVLAEESAKKKLYPETYTRKNHLPEPELKSPPAALVDSPPSVALVPAPAVSVETEPEHDETETANIASSSVLPIRDSSGT